MSNIRARQLLSNKSITIPTLPAVVQKVQTLLVLVGFARGLQPLAHVLGHPQRVVVLGHDVQDKGR